MPKRNLMIILLVIGFIVPSQIHAAAPFYEGKTIRLIVAGSAGGGYDAYARAVSRHMGRYIPGNPSILVEYMAGAGGLIAANHLYKVAKPDGLTIGSLLGGLLLRQALGQEGVEFDIRKFEYIGAPAKDTVVFLMTRASGITSLEKWRASNTPVKLGGVGIGAHAPDNVTRVVKSVLGFPIQLVAGYKGTAEIRLAIEGGELAGCGLGWESARVTWRTLLDAGDVIPVLQTGARAMPDLPNLPLAINLAKTEEERKLIQAGIHDPTLTARPYALSPGTPKERVMVLRQAFQKTLTDKEFLADVDKAKLMIDQVTGEEMEKTVVEIFKMDPALLSRLKEILFK